jgi:hypothetical protein
MRIQVEAVLYESAIDGLVELCEGRPRELNLCDVTAMLMRDLDTPGKMCSLAAMAVVMLEEERRRNEPT